MIFRTKAYRSPKFYKEKQNRVQQKSSVFVSNTHTQTTPSEDCDVMKKREVDFAQVRESVYDRGNDSSCYDLFLDNSVVLV